MAINTAGQTRTGNDAPAGQANFKTGRIVLDGTAITAADELLVELGFTPKYVQFVNVTDRIGVEWYEGMAADTCIKTAAAGTRTAREGSRVAGSARSVAGAAAARLASVAADATGLTDLEYELLSRRHVDDGRDGAAGATRRRASAEREGAVGTATSSDEHLDALDAVGHRPCRAGCAREIDLLNSRSLRGVRRGNHQ